MTNVLRKAVFPVAGLGSRFLPATKASPKEMLPIVDKPLIQYAVEEAAAAGITDLIFVTGRNKRAIEDHFDSVHELESELAAKGKHELLDLAQSVLPPGCRCMYIRQSEPLGLGHAVLCAQPIVGNEPFAVLLADDLIAADPPVMRSMAELYAAEQCSVLGVLDVPREQTGSYGIVEAKKPKERVTEIVGLVEKPEPANAPSTLAVVGRYVLTPAVFESLANAKPGRGGEIQLTDGIAGVLGRERVLAMRLHGRRYDCGSKLGYLEATVELGLHHPEVGADFRRYLQRLKI
ncbi:MAG TPA: UTP--glucose-1-phosphate uridylyltransferase GalU [Burkholderiales bacterium]|jgi:UTP--glucose-1-phosphate uridylyltransferase|nr:UTP--glucose-1-phosphate uridylyltransferase GalU [Burkholderiales bacterium]